MQPKNGGEKASAVVLLGGGGLHDAYKIHLFE